MCTYVILNVILEPSDNISLSNCRIRTAAWLLCHINLSSCQSGSLSTTLRSYTGFKLFTLDFDLLSYIVKMTARSSILRVTQAATAVSANLKTTFTARRPIVRFSGSLRATFHCSQCLPPFFSSPLGLGLSWRASCSMQKLCTYSLVQTSSPPFYPL